MEKEPKIEKLKLFNPNKIGLYVIKSANLMLSEYIKNGGTDTEYIEYLKGNRPDLRD